MGAGATGSRTKSLLTKSRNYFSQVSRIESLFCNSANSSRSSPYSDSKNLRMERPQNNATLYSTRRNRNWRRNRNSKSVTFTEDIRWSWSKADWPKEHYMNFLFWLPEATSRTQPRVLIENKIPQPVGFFFPYSSSDPPSDTPRVYLSRTALPQIRGSHALS